jgi:hypothetical protein
MRNLSICFVLTVVFCCYGLNTSAQCNSFSQIFIKEYLKAAELKQIKSVTDKENNTYIVGDYCSGSLTNDGKLDLGNGMVFPYVGLTDYVFLIKFNSFGVPQWYKLIRSGSYASRCTDISIDGAGYIYIIGNGKGASVIDGLPINIGYWESFIIKFDPSGKALWVKVPKGRPTTYSYILAKDISITSDGYFYVAGEFQVDTAKFDNIIVTRKSTNTGTINLFIAKYDTSGKAIWVKSFGAKSLTDRLDIDFTQVSSDEEKNIYVAGKYRNADNIKFDNIILNNKHDSTSLFIVKLNKNGEVKWAKQIIGSISIDNVNCNYRDGKLYLTFDYSGLANIGGFYFGGDDLQKTGILKMDTAGNVLKTRYLNAKYKSGLNSLLYTFDLKIDQQSNLYLGGYARGDSLNFDNFIHYGDTIYATASGFLLKMDSNLKVVCVYFDDADSDQWPENIYSFSLDDSGKVNVFLTRSVIGTAGYQKLNHVQLRNNFSVIPITKDLKCAADQNGEIQLRIFNGKRPYTIQWKGGLGSDSILTNLKRGVYQVDVTDANSCKQFAKAVIYSPPPFIINPTVTDDVKNQQKGRIVLQVSGGVPPYKYQWDDSPSHQTTSTAWNLFAGTYTCVITDAIGCIIDTAFIVKNLNGIADNDQIKFSFYPNPVTNGSFILEMTEVKGMNVSYSLFDALGKVVVEDKMITESGILKQNIRLPNPKPGIYYLQVSVNGSNAVREMVIF